MYDVTNLASFLSLPKWTGEMKKQNEKAKIMILGNKTDEAPNNRVVTEEMGQEYSEKNNFVFFETSASNLFNVKESLFEFVKLISHSETDRCDTSLEVRCYVSVNARNPVTKKNCCSN